MKNTKYEVNDKMLEQVNGGIGCREIAGRSSGYNEQQANEADRKEAGVGGAEGKF